MKMVFSLSTHVVVLSASYTDHELKERSRSLKCSISDWSMEKLNCSVYIRGSEWGSPHVGCWITFSVFVGCR